VRKNRRTRRNFICLGGDNLSIFNIFRKAKQETYPIYLDTGAYNVPKWSTQKDEEYIREGYRKITWVYSCVSIIAANVSQVPWELYRINRTNGVEKEILDHPILKLLNDRINPYMSAKDFFDLWATYLATQGKFYCLFNNAALPTQLYPLYPHYTKPIPDLNKFVNGFEYNVSGQSSQYNADQVLWSKFNDPLDLYDGMSPIRAMARTIDTENEAVDWNKAQLQNQAVPPGAIQVQNPSPEMANKLRSEWLKRYSGARNARVPLILNAEKANYIPFGLSTIDMDFIEQRKLSRVEICSAFGVPSQVVGDPEGQTYANYEEAVKSLWQQTVIPKYLDHMTDILNTYIATKYADNLKIKYNLDSIGALHESMDSLAERARGLYKDGIIKLNEARYMLKFEDVETGDSFYSQPAVATATTTTATVTTATTTTASATESKTIKIKTIDMSDEQKEMHWKSTEEKRSKYIDPCAKQFKDAFKDEQKQLLNAIKDIYDAEQIINAADRVINACAPRKKNILAAIYNLVISDFGEATYYKVAKNKCKKINIDFLTNAMIKYIATQTATEVVQINETTRFQLQEIIAKSIAEGAKIETIAEEIDKLYLDNIVPNRSKLIARTEVISASNYGSVAGAQKAQEDFDLKIKKIWIPTYDIRTRQRHLAMGEHPPVELDGTFNLGDANMQYPADLSGPAAEVCNCRCTVGYVNTKD